MKSKKLFLPIVLILILLGVLYKLILAPSLCDKYIEEGNSFLSQKKYEESIGSFDKAIKFNSKSTDARIQKSKAYIGQNEFEKAVDTLEEAQKIDLKDEELILEIIDIVETIDGGTAYEFLDRFVQEIGEANLSTKIEDILSFADKSPEIAEMDSSEGKYISPMWIKLNQEKMNIGHSYYYTTNGDTPDKNSQKYFGAIHISKTMTIKIIGYNKNGDSTEVSTFEYIIDEDILDDLKDNIEAAEDLISNTKTGTEVGDIPEKNKSELQSAVDKSKKLVKTEALKYDTIDSMIKELESAIELFKENIIKPTDKSELKSTISKAQSLYDNATEGTKTGQYKSGAKSKLKQSIDKAKDIYDEKTSTQEEIDAQVSSLNSAINAFKQNKVKQSASLEQKILGKYIIYDESNGMGVCKFTKNELKDGYVASEGYPLSILGRRESGNTIYYQTSVGEIPIEIIDDNTVCYGISMPCKLLNSHQLIQRVYERFGPDIANYEYLKYFGVTQSEIDYFYSN